MENNINCEEIVKRNIRAYADREVKEEDRIMEDLGLDSMDIVDISIDIESELLRLTKNKYTLDLDNHNYTHLTVKDFIEATEEVLRG